MDTSFKSYKKIRRIPTKFIPIMILAFLTINILSLALPLTMKKIYGNVILSKSTKTLQYVLIVAFVALFLEAIMRRVKESSSKWISAKYEYQLQGFLIRKVLSAYSTSTDQAGYIANLETFKAITSMTNFYSTAYYQLFIDVPFAAIFLYLIYLYGGILVFIPIIVSLLYMVIAFTMSQFYFSSRSNYMGHNDQLLRQLTESLEKIHFIKSAGIEESQITIYKRLLEKVTRTEYSSQKHQIMIKVLGSNISQLTLFLTLIGGGYLVSLNTITFGQITACAILGGRAVSPIISLMKYYQQTMDIKLLKKRIELIVSKEDQYQETTPDFPEDILGTIELMSLSYKNVHSGNEEVIDRVISSGEFVVIDPKKLPSYQKIMTKIMGKEPIENGKVLIDNLDISEWNMNSLKGKIEHLTEDVSIFKGSITENLTYFNHALIHKAYDTAAVTGLDELVSKMPEGFESKIDSTSINYLTAAFMQRLNITRALIERPRIILIDKIDENMDEDTLEMFIWLMKKLKGQSTVIIATNNRRLLELGDSEII